MTKWSDMLARIIPWFDTDDTAESQRLRQETCEQRRQQQLLSPLIDAQTEYLVHKGAINGFTAQLRSGFARRATGE